VKARQAAVPMMALLGFTAISHSEPISAASDRAGLIVLAWPNDDVVAAMRVGDTVPLVEVKREVGPGADKIELPALNNPAASRTVDANGDVDSQSSR
jgi:hypothetical protein